MNAAPTFVAADGISFVAPFGANLIVYGFTGVEAAVAAGLNFLSLPLNHDTAFLPPVVPLVPPSMVSPMVRMSTPPLGQ